MHTGRQSPLDALRIEPNGVPIYVQIREQMLGLIGTGALRPGEQMPTMRQVAVALKVDLNTVRHAYDELERTGAVTVKPARGTFVVEPPPHDPERSARRLDELARQVIATAVAMGVSPSAVGRHILQLAAEKEGER